MQHSLRRRGEVLQDRRRPEQFGPVGVEDGVPVTGPHGPPPAVRFAWGRLIYNGIIDEVTEDIDRFAPNGTALHAKVAVTIFDGKIVYKRESKTTNP